MERKPLRFELTIPLSAGSGSESTPDNSAIANAGGYLRQVIVKATHSADTFDFRIENSNGRNIYKATEQVGELIEDKFTPMPAGTYICYIENAKRSGGTIIDGEDFEAELIYGEVY